MEGVEGGWLWWREGRWWVAAVEGGRREGRGWVAAVEGGRRWMAVVEGR